MTPTAMVGVALPETSARDVFATWRRVCLAGMIGIAAAFPAALVLWAWMPANRKDHARHPCRRGGDHPQRVPVSGPAELREMAEDVNVMADSVQVSNGRCASSSPTSRTTEDALTSIRGFSQALLDGTPRHSRGARPRRPRHRHRVATAAASRG